jgi:hypothetical protein
VRRLDSVPCLPNGSAVLCNRTAVPFTSSMKALSLSMSSTRGRAVQQIVPRLERDLGRFVLSRHFIVPVGHKIGVQTVRRNLPLNLAAAFAELHRRVTGKASPSMGRAKPA